MKSQLRFMKSQLPFATSAGEGRSLMFELILLFNVAFRLEKIPIYGPKLHQAMRAPTIGAAVERLAKRSPNQLQLTL